MGVEYPVMTLARYAARIGYSECAFFGIHHPDNATYACRTLWTQPQRDEIWHQLLLAQGMIEDVIGYPLAARWIENDRQPYGRYVQARWGRVIEAGVLSDVMVEAGAPVGYGTDPAVIGPVAVGDYTEADLHLFHVGTDIEIPFDDVTITGGAADFEVPWCRLVDPAHADNPITGWDYADVAVWGAEAVDVRALVTDPSTQGVLSGRAICNGCAGTEGTACTRVRDGRLGLLEVSPATWDEDSESWRSCDPCGGCWEYVTLAYRAGELEPTRLAEDTVIRLAHANMPTEPCGCNVTQRLWERDRSVPQVVTRERLNCPFGISDGAWMAWRYATQQRIVRSGVFA